MKNLLKSLSLALFVAATLLTQSAHIQTSLPSDTIPATSPSPHFCKAIGGPENEWGESLIQTSDGGYAIAGHTESFGAGKWDVYVVKLDKNGNACCAVSQTSRVGSGGRLRSATSSIGSGGTLTNQCP